MKTIHINKGSTSIEAQLVADKQFEPSVGIRKAKLDAGKIFEFLKYHVPLLTMQELAKRLKREQFYGE